MRISLVGRQLIISSCFEACGVQRFHLQEVCDSVDVIRTQPYNGDVIKYPGRELDLVSCVDGSNCLTDEIFEYNDIVGSTSGNTFVKEILNDNVRSNSVKPTKANIGT